MDPDPDPHESASAWKWYAGSGSASVWRWQARKYAKWAYFIIFARFWAFIWKLGSGSGFASKWKAGSGSASASKWKQDPDPRIRITAYRYLCVESNTKSIGFFQIEKNFFAVLRIRIHRIHMFLGPWIRIRIHSSQVWIRIRILLSSCKNSKKDLDS